MDWKPVLSKRDFVKRYSEGEFGNASPTYQTPTDLSQRGNIFTLYHLRNRTAGGTTYYNVSWEHCLWLWDQVDDWRGFYASEMAPTDRTLIQGEVLQTERGIEFFCSTVAKPMREALALSSQRLSGIIAVSTLRKYLCPNSLEWLYVLLERYPFHVVELSTYSVNWGTLPRYNTVFWEVRQY